MFHLFKTENPRAKQLDCMADQNFPSGSGLKVKRTKGIVTYQILLDLVHNAGHIFKFHAWPVNCKTNTCSLRKASRASWI